MSRQVLVRRDQLSGDAQMLRAEVLSEKDGILRVMLPGARKPVEVKASETMNPEKVFGTRDQRVASVLPKCYPSSPQALGNRYR